MTAESNLTVRERWEKWEQENPEKARQAEAKKQARWRVKNPEKTREATAKRRREHPEKVREAIARYKAKDPERFRAIRARSKAKSRRAHPEKHRERNQKWRAKNPEKARRISARATAKYRANNSEKVKEKSRIAQKKRLYGLTSDQWNALFDSQQNRCAICRTDGPAQKYWHTDHCHVTKVVRGILCASCNHMLGAAKDRSDILRKGAVYLETLR